MLFIYKRKNLKTTTQKKNEDKSKAFNKFELCIFKYNHRFFVQQRPQFNINNKMSIKKVYLYTHSTHIAAVDAALDWVTIVNVIPNHKITTMTKHHKLAATPSVIMKMNRDRQPKNRTKLALTAAY